MPRKNKYKIPFTKYFEWETKGPRGWTYHCKLCRKQGIDSGEIKGNKRNGHLQQMHEKVFDGYKTNGVDIVEKHKLDWMRRREAVLRTDVS